MSKSFTLSRSRFNLLLIMLTLVCGYFMLTRLALLGFSFSQVELNLKEFISFNIIGFIYDIAFFAYAAIPFVIYCLLLPNRWWTSRINKALVHGVTFLVLYGMGFVAVAEWLFWNEFNVRFNFIAVDYLVYRREVTNNIIESYPLFSILTIILFVSVSLYYFILRPKINRALAQTEPFSTRVSLSAGILLLPLISLFTLGQDLHSFSANSYSNELASNGPYQFFAAFRNNDLDYNTFYKTLPDNEISSLLKEKIISANETYRSPQLAYSIERRVESKGQQKHLNVVLIMVESLSADYLGSFGNQEHLTPNLDKLAEESLFFEQLYATGTRTTRGLEAVTLSIPPTPGRSIVKRIGRETGMWSLGNVLKEKGYNTQFIYGGDGYFDNMNTFFAGNGYGIIDKSDIPEDQVLFSNAWGVSDEDLFTATLKAADDSAQQDKPFFFHLMTTSNHRPYTYPEDRIDIPSGTGRNGAVKYTDWAIGDFLKKAKNKPWFDETIFIVVADHCAGSAGKTALPIEKYHIPMFIYAPSQLSAKKITTLASQIDLAPTLLGLLNMSYDSYAFGRDIFSIQPEEGRALIGNYQHLGLYYDEKLSILSPTKKMSTQFYEETRATRKEPLEVPDEHMTLNIAYYQAASHIYQKKMNNWQNMRLNRAD
tara:strand:+ start:35707 stop:37665 length:1959 start_codon:yes stop_codon:yes gene_type:complete